jgi:hypothetical protein
MLKGFNRLGRVLGVLCGAALALAWLFAMWSPSAGLTLSGISFVVALFMVVFALFAAIASVYGHSVVVVLLFLASFFPIGAALLPADHWLRYIGVGDVGLLLAAVVMWVTKRLALAAQPARGDAA